MKKDNMTLLLLVGGGLFLWDRSLKSRGSSIGAELGKMFGQPQPAPENEGQTTAPQIPTPGSQQGGNTGSLNMGGGSGETEPPGIETLPGGISGAGKVAGA